VPLPLYLAKRVALLLWVLILISIVIFTLMHSIPGDPMQVMYGIMASPENIEMARRQLGLDKPVYIQYLVWLTNMLQGNFGASLRTHRPVLQSVLERVPATFLLTMASMTIALVIGILSGVVSASKPGSKLDYIGAVLAQLGMSMPDFWLGIILILVFSVRLQIFPSSGYASMIENPFESLRHLALPAITVGTINAAIITRMTRSSMLEVLSQDYIRTARSKGLSERLVVYKHALKNSLIPVVTVVGTQFGYLLGGVIIVETIFAYPGVGRLLYTSIYQRDYPLVQGSVLTLAFAFCLVNLIVDILYLFLDPRIRYD